MGNGRWVGNGMHWIRCLRALSLIAYQGTLMLAKIQSTTEWDKFRFYCINRDCLTLAIVRIPTGII